MAVVADDLAPPSSRRFSLWTAIRRNPTVAFGVIMLALLILSAVFAPLTMPSIVRRCVRSAGAAEVV